MRVLSHRTKSGNGRTYNAPDAADIQRTEGVSGDGPARTHNIALFRLTSVREGALEELGATGVGCGPEKGLGKEVLICGCGVLSRCG
jgi:hypothetical protein